jgi:hypothetical protein
MISDDQNKGGDGRFKCATHFSPGVLLQVERNKDERWQELCTRQERILSAFEKEYKHTQQQILDWHAEMKAYAEGKPHLKQEAEKWDDFTLVQKTLLCYKTPDYTRWSHLFLNSSK